MSSVSWASRSDERSFQQKKKVNRRVHETQIGLQVFCVGRNGTERYPEVEAVKRVSTVTVNGETRVIKCCHRIMVSRWHINVETF